MALAQQRRLALPCYIVAVAMMILPVFDQMMQLASKLNLSDARWRYGALGSVSYMLLLPLLGMTIAFALSAVFEHRTWQRVLSVVAVAGIVLIVIAMGMFTLDAIEVRSLMRKEAQSTWAVATLTALAKYVLAAIVLAGFAKAGFAAPKPTKAPVKARDASLIIGNPSRPAQEDAEHRPTVTT